MEPGRIHFSWISSAEGVKFAQVANDIIEEVRKLGPAKYFIKQASMQTSRDSIYIS
ncbi:hydrogenase iron-sulfur subunit [Desulfobacterium sp. N47]|uniref:hydrogenase iron-sulfur subunit n=1 Tax=Desulfobacterium sp. N47 TaxID=3115210 RepID=UPI003CC289E1